MKYSKDTKCLAPFIESVAKFLPKNRLKAVKGFKVPFGHQERRVGVITTNNGWYTISLLTYRQQPDGTYKAIITEDLLANLAHELAHILFWEHDVNFARTAHKFQGIFINELSRLGVSDIQARYTDTLNCVQTDKNRSLDR